MLRGVNAKGKSVVASSALQWKCQASDDLYRLILLRKRVVWGKFLRQCGIANAIPERCINGPLL
ncbi:hypothetical protein Pr1d_38580 [Bythopirellula goksoeyrii]|uniref:Uncharacterized protein n=1 Tax=Bythopirellula goksoeyrii TaxID=1400387 RepID=A0A5B9QBZ0_9BACT|nr:hypothetical protein Pr1d_38580 [Bythopirellula goksoeyrii]